MSSQVQPTSRDKSGLALLFGGMLCLLAASIGLVYWIGLLALKTDRALVAQRGIIDELDRMVSALKDVETGQRGYLLTGEMPYLEPYSNGLIQVSIQLGELSKVGGSGQIAPEEIRKLHGLVADKLAELDETIRTYHESGAAAAQALMRSGRGKRLMDQIRLEVLRLQQVEQKDYEDSRDKADKASLARNVTFIGMAMVNFIFLLWAYRQILQRIRQRDAALTEAEKQREVLATTLASIGDAVIVTDARGAVTFLNPEAERLTGFKNAEARGALLPSIFKIVNEHTRRPVENPVEKVLRLGTIVDLANHTVLVAKDGKETAIDDSGAPIRHEQGPLQGVVLVFRDITAQRKAQMGLERLASIVQSSEDAILSKDLEGRILTWNPQAERMFGYRADEIIGKSITILSPPDRAEEETQILERLKRGEQVTHFETVRVTKTGARLDLSMTISPLRDPDGIVIGASNITRDIRVQKQALEALAHHREQLEREVRDRTASLQETTDQLNTFVYTIAHDLRAPLRAQHGFANVLLEDFGPALGNQGTDYIEKIKAAAARLDTLVTDLLSYASLSREKPELRPVDLGRVVKQASEDFADTISATHATIDLAPIAEIVLAHEGSLQLVVNNLLDNALKFVKAGTSPQVRIWSEIRPPTSAPNPPRQDRFVRLWVQDNGIGIAPQYQDKVFGVFQRLHTAEIYPGTGIGLALVKKGVERLGGHVGLESTPGEGTKFWVELKLAESK